MRLITPGYRLRFIIVLATALTWIVSSAEAQYRHLGFTYGWSQFDRGNEYGQKIGRGDRYGLIFRQDLNERFFLGLDLGIFSKQMVRPIEGSDQQTLADHKLNSIEMSVFYQPFRKLRTDYFAPYIGGGGGFHSIMIEIQGVSFHPRSESRFGLHLVGGLWVKVPRLPIRLFAEAQVGRIFARKEDRDFSFFKSVYGGAALLLLK